MATNEPQEALFKSVAPDGKTVMLSVGEDGAWTITQDGKTIADGIGEGPTIAAAVRRFRAMIHPHEPHRRSSHSVS